MEVSGRKIFLIQLNELIQCLSISVVSLEENEDYTSPPGVFQEKDRTRPDEEYI
ncbi:MAG: hypothetical protein MZV64_46940 [Ignavibacteriales bacterium]|nr:hypothetical protein [Ignavibacteriales bacterium]